MRTVEIIKDVTAIDRTTAEGREAARRAIDGICSEIGATELQKNMVSDALFSAHARPRISLSKARKMFGGVSRVTFWRWRRDNRFGLGGIAVIPVNERAADVYLDEVLEAMKERAKNEQA